MYKDILSKGIKIKIIGDSIAAGAGSSMSHKTEELIFENKGCGGAFSYQINKHLDVLISSDDNIVLVLMGLNDRKRVNGMEELKTNCESVINQLKSKEKIVVLLTPTPSAHSNEYYPNRIYHTDEVVEILCNIAVDRKILLVDNYKYIMEHLAKNQLVIDEAIYGEK
jgi:hypothetical protein